MVEAGPTVVVYTPLFPHPGQPTAGTFIRERMFRVGKTLPIVVVVPQPWFPFQHLLRRLRPHFRPDAPRYEVQDGFEVYRPRFFSLPGAFKFLDGYFMAIGSRTVVRNLQRKRGIIVLDAHFAYPAGYAASLLSRWLDIPFTVTLRGTEVPHGRDPRKRHRMLNALTGAARVFAVSNSLKRHAMEMGADGSKIRVVGNGVDPAMFAPVDRRTARNELGLPAEARVLITIGGLVERKGFHRVIELLPALRRDFPALRYLIVGGAGAEGDWGPRLEAQVAALGLQGVVHFLGPMLPKDLRRPLSAADVFVLATRNEGWANVILEAMACGLPVIATDVGGNREVVCRDDLGAIVPFGDARALEAALRDALGRAWDRKAILAYARDNDWDKRVAVLVEEFRTIAPRGRGAVICGQRPAA
jgi:glycosyltransferase involved in cell wall biosynthesis